MPADRTHFAGRQSTRWYGRTVRLVRPYCTSRLAVIPIVVATLAMGCGEDEEPPAGGSDPAEPAPAEFGYTGAIGPSEWGELDPAYSACSEGSEQSPVDLGDAKPGPVPEISFDYEPATATLINNGHSVEAELESDSSIEVDGSRFALSQFHYHAPSEHRVGERAFPMELHFVHQGPGEEIFVLGALVDAGEANPAYDDLVEALPADSGESAELANPIDPAELLPPGFTEARHRSYEGSLTTPPCSEGVSWSVLEQPLELSEDQIARYTSIYSSTNRPLQPLNGRAVHLGP